MVDFAKWRHRLGETEPRPSHYRRPAKDHERYLGNVAPLQATRRLQALEGFLEYEQHNNERTTP